MSTSGSIYELLSEKHISLRQTADRKGEVIDLLVDLVGDHPFVRDRDGLKKDIVERETLQSTGVGGGIAIPHAKSVSVVGPLVALVTLESAVDFNSIDNQKVDLAFLVAGPKNAASMHIRILSRLSRLLHIQEVCEQLKAIENPSEIVSYIKSYETQIWG